MWYQWKPYVPVAKRRAQAAKKMEALRKKGQHIEPVMIEGRKIARTFWGEAWCEHLESFSDYENRLPRGRTYVRNGSVCHLGIVKGKVDAKVSGSELYNVKVQIKTLPAPKWNTVRQQCAGQIGSLLELLSGRLSDNIMAVVTDRKQGLFPLPGEMTFSCDCPDWAGMCKHVAAVLYGVGARLDQKPELLFLLRGVDHEELISADAESAVNRAVEGGGGARLETDDLSEVFGIDLADGAILPSGDAPPAGSPTKSASGRKGRRKSSGKTTAKSSTKATKPKAAKSSTSGRKRVARSEASKTPAKSQSTKKKASQKPKTRKSR